MRYSLPYLALCATALVALPVQAQTAVPARISVEVFAAQSTFLLPELSPDGNKLLVRMSANGATSVAVADLNGSGLEALTLPEKSELVRYMWAGNNRIVFVMGQQLPWYDGQGDRYVTRAFSYDLASGKTVPLGPKVMGVRGDDILWIDPNGQTMLLSAQPDQYNYPSVFRIDLSTGKSKLEQGPYDFVWDWYADRAGVIRMGVGYQSDGWFVRYRKSEKDGYSSSPSVSWRNGDASRALRLLKDSDEGYAFSDKSGRTALYHYSFATRRLGAMVYGSDTNDIDDADFDEITGEPVSVTITEDRTRVIWLDPVRKASQANLEKTFGRSALVVSRSRDGKRSILWVGSSTDPGSYYLLDADSGALKRLAKVAEGVDRAALAETKYVRYTARDGTVIPAYLTLPKGRDPKNLPLIIVPHGGPYGIRDSLEYDNEVQFLANRGYAVLQPNYRGSGGYGKAFYDKGKGQWGRAMQDDVDDGMDWLVKQGIVDAKRVCLVGGSYGGYVALWGATRNPERYRCAVSFAGVSDLKAQLNYQSDFLIPRWDRSDWQKQVQGEKGFDLTTVSPLARVADLKVPIMLVHGDKDTRVPLKQTTLYDKALTAAGKPHETYIYPGEGHGFDKAKDEQSYLERLEAFLTKYNPS